MDDWKTCPDCGCLMIADGAGVYADCSDCEVITLRTRLARLTEAAKRVKHDGFCQVSIVRGGVCNCPVGPLMEALAESKATDGGG